MYEQKCVCEKEREEYMCVLSVHVAYTYIENSKHVYVYK